MSPPPFLVSQCFCSSSISASYFYTKNSLMDKIFITNYSSSVFAYFYTLSIRGKTRFLEIAFPSAEPTFYFNLKQHTQLAKHTKKNTCFTVIYYLSSSLLTQSLTKQHLLLQSEWKNKQAFCSRKQHLVNRDSR